MRGALLSLALFFCPDLGHAQISVDRVIINMHHGARPIQNIVVRNSGADTLSVSVIPDVMVRPGFSDEKREATDQLVASPKRFSIEPNGQRTVRLVLRKFPDDQEAVYRVKFIPQAKPFEEESLKPEKKKQTSLKVVFTVGILVLAEPKAVKPSLTWTRENDSITFRNEGNVNIYLEEGKYCSNGEQDCHELPTNRLYPGNTLQVKAPKEKPVIYRKRVGDEFENIVIQPNLP